MDISAQTDEAATQLMLIAQREEINKIFDVPEGSFFEDLINKGEQFENLDPTPESPTPHIKHQRLFKVKDLLGDEVKTVIVETVQQGKLTKTTFSIVRMTADSRAANRLDISYSRHSDNTPSVVTVHAVPSGQLHGIAFNLDSNDRIDYIDNTSPRGTAPVDLVNAPSELKLFNGMKINELKADSNSLAFKMHEFPYPESQPTQIVIPRTLGRV